MNNQDIIVSFKKEYLAWHADTGKAGSALLLAEAVTRAAQQKQPGIVYDFNDQTATTGIVTAL